MRPFYVLTQSDVGRSTIRAFGRVWPTANFIGRIGRIDAGKRVYLISAPMRADLLQVESHAQRVARMADELSDEQIGALRTAAGQAGDFAQVELCDHALEGDNEARAKCAEAIWDAEGQKEQA